MYKNTLEISKKESFNFEEKIITVYLAEYFKKLYNKKFIYQNDHMYFYNDVYWKGEHKSNLITINIFLGKTFFQQLDNELTIYRNSFNTSKMDVEQECTFNNKITKIKKSLSDLVNYDKRIKIVRECIHFLNNDDIEFDEQPTLFSFNNKIFDLEKSEFIKPKSNQYISLTCGYDFDDSDQDEKIEELNKLLISIFPNDDIKDLYLTLLSTGLDGIPLEKFILANGNGGNGKGLLNEFVQHMIGNYSYVLPSNVLLQSIKAGSNTEIGNMNKKRMVFSREPDSNMAFNCSTIKEITGGSEINARVIYSKDTKVNLNLTFILECNEKPKLNEVNDALRRRIIDIPFKMKFVDKQEYDEIYDTHLVGIINPLYKQKKFKNDYKHALFIILSQYYKKFHDSKRNITLPPEIIKRNNDYMKGSDELFSWINNTYEKTNDKKDNLKLKDVYNTYKDSDYFRNLKKEQKKLVTYTDFHQKLENNIFLKNLVRQNKDKTLCLYQYKEIVGADFVDIASDDIDFDDEDNKKYDI